MSLAIDILVEGIHPLVTCDKLGRTVDTLHGRLHQPATRKKSFSANTGVTETYPCRSRCLLQWAIHCMLFTYCFESNCGSENLLEIVATCYTRVNKAKSINNSRIDD